MFKSIVVTEVGELESFIATHCGKSFCFVSRDAHAVYVGRIIKARFFSMLRQGIIVATNGLWVVGGKEFRGVALAVEWAVYQADEERYMGKMHVQTHRIRQALGMLMRARNRVDVLSARGWSMVYRLRAGQKIRAVKAVTQVCLKLTRLRAVYRAGLAEFGVVSRTQTFYRASEGRVRVRRRAAA